MHLRSPLALLPLVAALAGPLVACGGPSKEAGGPNTAKTGGGEVTVEKPKERMVIITELGGLQPGVWNKNIAALKPRWVACYHEAHAKNEALGGSISFYLRTNHDGSVKYVHVKTSTMGDRAVERCITESIRGANWGEPIDANEGEYQSYSWAVENDEDQPVDVGNERVTPALAKAKKQLDACREKASAKGAIHATFWIGAKGKPLSIGFSFGDPSGEGAADCMHGVLMGLTYVNPSQQITKTTIDLE